LRFIEDGRGAAKVTSTGRTVMRNGSPGGMVVRRIGVRSDHVGSFSMADAVSAPATLRGTRGARAV
jgi:hypothetical protein